jgi:hypothetical protein
VLLKLPSLLYARLLVESIVSAEMPCSIHAAVKELKNTVPVQRTANERRHRHRKPPCIFILHGVTPHHFTLDC